MENRVTILKREIKEGARSIKDLAFDAEQLIRSTIIVGLEDAFFQEYCIYAQALGLNFVNDGIMSVSMSGCGETSLNICALGTIRCVKTEREILFLIAHEVKHLISCHLSKYMDMFKNEVQALFMNLATDVEVNEGLRTELGIRNENCIPSTAFGWGGISTILGKTVDKTPTKGTIASYVYALLNQKCKETLGGNFLELLYEVKITKSDFMEQIAMVAYDLPSIFSIKDKEEAKRFCRELLKYIDYSNSFIVVCVPSGASLKKQVGKGSKGKSSLIGDGSNTNGGCNPEGNETGQSKQNGNTPGENSNKDGSKKNSPRSNETGDKCSLEKTQSEKSNGKKEKSHGRGSNSVISSELSVDDIILLEQNLLDIMEELKSNVGSHSRSNTGTGRGGSLGKDRKKHQIPWQSVLRNKLHTMSSAREGTKRRLNRRLPERMDLSGTKPKQKLDIIIGIDESGSVSSRELMYAISEIEGITSLFDCSIHIIEFTSIVNKYTYYKKSRDFKRDSKRFSTRYSGGTCAQCVYDKADKLRKVSKSRSVVLVLTDGCIESSIDFKGFKHRLWVYTEEFNCKNELAKNVYKLVEV